jgi:hypothetical protein
MSVRWDEVVANSSCPYRKGGTGGMAAAETERAISDGPVEVRVRLFGMLVGPEVENPMALHFDQGCTLRDVVKELGRRVGPDLLRTLVKENGESFNTCRLFLDGEPVQDMTTKISPRGPAGATVEIILFREIEGG